MRLLLAEDEKMLSDALVTMLTHNNYSVDAVYNGQDALDYLETGDYDGAILDIMMPKMSGLEVCREIRAFERRMPIMMLTARNSENDMIEGLGAGADDYVTKPFSLALLFARVAALLRRSENCASACRAYKIGEHTVDLVRMSILSPDGAEKPLAAREAELLEILHRHRGEVLRREYLLDRVWGFNFYGNTRTLDQHIALVRRKLGGDSALLRTVRNIGYRLD